MSSVKGFRHYDEKGNLIGIVKYDYHSLDNLPQYGFAELDKNGIILSSQLPSYVDDVLEGYLYNSEFYEDSAHTKKIKAESGKVYVDVNSNLTYRWSGTKYVPIASDLALGETSATAYRGDRGKIAYDHSQLKGSAFASNIYKFTTNEAGHITNATAVTKEDITNLGIPSKDTTYDVGGAVLGLVKNGGNVVINSDGTMTAPSYESEGENSFATNETSIGLCDYSFASGINTISGGKGFKVLSRTGKIGGSGSYTLDSIVGLEIGDQYSIRLQNNYDYNGIIESISTDTNIITVTNYIDEEVDSSRVVTLWIPEKPTIGTTKLGQGSHAEGYQTRALCYGSHAEGCNTEAGGRYSHAEGNSTKAGYSAHAEGVDTKALGVYSHAEGNSTTALGHNSHSEGNRTTALGYNSHAEGLNTFAEGNNSHAEGNGTTAEGSNSHAEGTGTTAYANQSHAEGLSTFAKGDQSHAEGLRCHAEGSASHAEGADTMALGVYSHAEGLKTIASGEHQHVQGRYNIEDTTNTYAHIVGGGTSTTNRKNIHTLDWNGNAWYRGSVTISDTVTLKYDSDTNSLVFSFK